MLKLLTINRKKLKKHLTKRMELTMQVSKQLLRMTLRLQVVKEPLLEETKLLLEMAQVLEVKIQLRMETLPQPRVHLPRKTQLTLTKSKRLPVKLLVRSLPNKEPTKPLPTKQSKPLKQNMTASPLTNSLELKSPVER